VSLLASYSGGEIFYNLGIAFVVSSDRISIIFYNAFFEAIYAQVVVVDW
jgi:hypothetical protein